MLISFVVRLSSVALAAGGLAGEVEHVLSGERGQFRDAAELAAWCAQQPPTVPGPRPAPGALHLLASLPADPGDRS